MQKRTQQGFIGLPVLIGILLGIIALIGVVYFWSLTGQEGIKKIATLPDNATEFYAGPRTYAQEYDLKGRSISVA